jgi:hypothetical protein
MKKVYEYLDEIESVEFNQSDDIFYRNSIIEELIKRIQLETIEETCKICAENAKIRHDYYDYDTPELYNKYKHEGFERCDGDGVQYGVDVVSIDKNSILNCLEILKKEL